MAWFFAPILDCTLLPFLDPLSYMNVPCKGQEMHSIYVHMYDGEISTCGWIIEVHSIQSTMMGRL